MTKINLNQLRKEIRGMNRQHALYRVLRDELTILGFWKQRPRGNPTAAYRHMKEEIDRKRHLADG